MFQAKLKSAPHQHVLTVSSQGQQKSINIPAAANGKGSSVNGGELLLAALATCFCNDLYREAAKVGIEIREIEVEAQADFPEAGKPGQDFRYQAKVVADASTDEIIKLLHKTDQCAEIQSSLRAGRSIEFKAITA